MVNDLGERQESYFCKFTFGQFVTFATLEIAMLFFVFYLGARFGPEIAGLQPLHPSDSESDSDVENPRDVLEIPSREVLSYTDPQPGAPNGSESALKTLRSSNAEPDAKPDAKIDDQLLRGTQNVVRVKSSDRALYTVQVGSYPTVREGTGMVERWKGRGYEAYLTLGEIPGRGIWYRVRIGNFGSKEEAEHLARLINAKEKSSAIVVAQED